jgi:hypothetical protein
MKTIKIACLFLAASLLSSCLTAPFYPRYHVYGNEDGKRAFTGTMTNDFFDGKMIMTFNSADGRTMCTGPVIASHLPEASFTCDEAEGTMQLECTNYGSLFNEQLSLHWKAAGCDKGFGSGASENGDIFHFNYYKKY